MTYASVRRDRLGDGDPRSRTVFLCLLEVTLETLAVTMDVPRVAIHFGNRRAVALMALAGVSA